MSELSPATRALLRAAREDAPNAATRAKMWAGVGGGGVGAATAATAVGTSAAKGLALSGSAKLLLAGALLGSAVTVGLAALALRVTPLAPREAPTVAIQGESIDAPPATVEGPPAPVPAVGPVPPHAVPRSAPVSHGSHAPGHARHDDGSDDALDQEAAILAEARGSLMRGDPEAALAAIRAEQALPHRVLEPEALALEARAMRVEGRDRDADVVEETLRTRYPQNALSH